jgi:hypothetical protein
LLETCRCKPSRHSNATTIVASAVRGAAAAARRPRAGGAMATTLRVRLAAARIACELRRTLGVRPYGDHTIMIDPEPERDALVWDTQRRARCLSREE